MFCAQMFDKEAGKAAGGDKIVNCSYCTKINSVVFESRHHRKIKYFETIFSS